MSSASSWEGAIADCLASYSYQPFPAFIAAKGFSPEEQAQFPLATDGLDFWFVVKKYVTAYLSIFYPREDMIAADAELQDYWDHFKTRQTGLDLGLPKVLSRDALIDHTTFSIFSVTGGTQR